MYEICKLFVTEGIPPISLGLNMAREQVASRHALVHETRNTDNGHSMKEQKIVPYKLTIEYTYMI
jgi:hypothetical protein